MEIKYDKLLDDVRERDRSYVFHGSRTKKATNSYFESDGLFTNVVPIYIPQDMFLDSISVTTDGIETWVAEVHRNGLLIVGATLSISATNQGNVKGLGIAVSEGSLISFYVNGVDIEKPRIVVTFKN